MMAYEEFARYGEMGFDLVPLWSEMPLPPKADALAFYCALANQGNDYLFESRKWRGAALEDQYAIIGLPSAERLELNEGSIRRWRDGAVIWERHTDDPVAALREIQASIRVPAFEDLPPFAGGLFGYFGFETSRLIEPRLRRTVRKPSGVPVPDAVQFVSRELVVLDYLKRRILVIVHAESSEPDGYTRARERCLGLTEQVRAFDAVRRGAPAEAATAQPVELDALRRWFSRQDYEAAVERVKEYIIAGDVMQVVLSQRLSRQAHFDAATLYRALSDVARAPYGFLVNLGACQLVGASPEMLIQHRNGVALSKPMAGTRRRTHDAAEDERLRRALLEDPKELAEHMMLVDLARNDLGRLARAGGVRVEELLKVEFFSHVMHIVSAVTGQMPQAVIGLDVMRATFPAGTLSGAAKVRAMEVIAELEPHSRGPYGGVVGALGWNGDADLAITIRTGVLCEGTLHVQAGAGIVYDSVAGREWQETMDKSMMMLVAAQRAEQLAAANSPLATKTARSNDAPDHR